MTNDANITGGGAELRCDLLAVSLSKEGEQYHRVLSGGQVLQTSAQGFRGLGVDARGLGGEIGARIEPDRLGSRRGATQVVRTNTRGAENEGRQPSVFAHPARAQALNCHQHDLLREIVGEMPGQVPQRIQANSPRKPAMKLGLGERVAALGADSSRKFFVSQVAHAWKSFHRGRVTRTPIATPPRQHRVDFRPPGGAMGITNSQSGTRIDEVAEGIYRICTPVPPSAVPGGFTFNQYLLVDEQPLLFHTGPRGMAPLIKEAIASVMPIERLRWVSFSHVEADECGGLNELLAAAPGAAPLCGRVAAQVSVNDLANRPAHALGDGEQLSLGKKSVQWLDAPHVPHGWDCGFLFEKHTRTLLCGDLFTQGGADHRPLIDGDILESSEAFRKAMDYYSHTKNAVTTLARIATTAPTTLACMHGSAWTGDGAALITALAKRLDT